MYCLMMSAAEFDDFSGDWTAAGAAAGSAPGAVATGGGGDEASFTPVSCGIGSRTGILVSAVPTGRDRTAFDQLRSGLHHFCLRARNREDVDAVYRFLKDELAARIVHPPEDGPFAPGYYSVLFEDPDGIRVEVNHVPGKGHLGPGGRLGPTDRIASSPVAPLCTLQR